MATSSFPPTTWFPLLIERTSGEVLAANGLKTFACSETQKFGHVTFFWNGNRSGYFNEELETYVEIPSDNVPFNQAPLMKAREITAAGKEALKSGKYDVVRVNYANPDMVGHTGDMAATVAACEECDACVKELLDLVDELGGMYLVTADHGNADDMVQRNKKGECIKSEDGVTRCPSLRIPSRPFRSPSAVPPFLPTLSSVMTSPRLACKRYRHIHQPHGLRGPR